MDASGMRQIGEAMNLLFRLFLVGLITVPIIFALLVAAVIWTLPAWVLAVPIVVALALWYVSGR